MPKPKSYLHNGKFSEYFDGTLVKLKGRLFYIRGCETGAQGVRVVGLDGQSHVLQGECYDDIVSQVEVFLPPTRWFYDSREESYWLLSYTPSSTYKRSMSPNRYRSSMKGRERLSLPKGSRGIPAHDYSYGEVGTKSLSEALVYPTIAFCVALDKYFCLYMGDDFNCPLILFKNYPVAKVTDGGYINIHPSYYHHFKERIGKFGEVLNAY